MARVSQRFAALCVVAWVLACGSNKSGAGNPGGSTGGAGQIGGMTATGGVALTGGAASIGGSGAPGNTPVTTGGTTSVSNEGTVGGQQNSGGAPLTGKAGTTSAASSIGGAVALGGSRGTGGERLSSATGGSTQMVGTQPTGGATPSGDSGTSMLQTGGSTSSSKGQHPFPQHVFGTYCSSPKGANDSDVVAAYQDWKTTVVTSDGAGGYLRVKKPDSGSVIGSTVSEGIGYGMILAVYMGDQSLLDNLWKYEQTHLDSSGLMNWEIGPDNVTTSGGSGAATDGDEDMAWALVMADRQWGGNGSLNDTYLSYAKALVDLIWTNEVDHNRGEMLKPGDQWGDVDVTNPSYFAPAYYRIFGQVTGKTQDWDQVVDASYSIIAKSLNAASGNQDNGLVPAWCNSSGTPVVAFSGAPTNFQNDSTRTPFRVGQDYCYFGESRAHDYLAKIMSFYASVGVAKITNGYDLNGTAHPDKVYAAGLQAASFVGPAGVAAMSDAQYQQFLDDAYAEVATLKLAAGTIYYQKSWTTLSLLMMTGNLVPF